MATAALMKRIPSETSRPLSIGAVRATARRIDPSDRILPSPA
jgi:hypothetical protein